MISGRMTQKLPAILRKMADGYLRKSVSDLIIFKKMLFCNFHGQEIKTKNNPDQDQ
jgi:hypothetical protein